MKRLSLILIFLFSFLAALAEGLSERVYVSTDRQVYVAGDRVWCSAFCLDASTGGYSDFSSVAYLELHSAKGLAQTAKVALLHGRGASVIELPASLPTGNYKLIAYTRQNLNEDGFDFLSSARTISIFNLTSSARVEGGVEIVEDIPAPVPAAENVGDFRVSIQGSASVGQTVPVKLSSVKAASLSVSVWHDDGIAAVATPDITDFVSCLRPGSSFTYNHLPEYEGEIINGKVVGLSPGQLDSLSGYIAFISSPGDMRDVYSSPIMSDGSVTFYTNNIYGHRDLVCEIENLGPGRPGHIELDSPFVNVDAGEIKPLKISPSMSGLITARGNASRIEQLFDADTLYDRIPYRENLLLDAVKAKTYLLDDYTRFPLMEEVFVEYVSEIRARRTGGKRDIRILVNDLFESARFSEGTSLMMLDGVPIFDHEKIFKYDPLLVKSLSIYPNTMYLGARFYEGIANFSTYKGNLPGIDFDANVRIVDFRGPSIPVAFTCSRLVHDGRYPDYRQTAYWHPILELKPNVETMIDIVLPSYPGHFVLTVEGIAEDGSPIRYSSSIDVN